MNIQPENSDGHQKINIVDVLKLDTEVSDSDVDADDDLFDDDEAVDPVEREPEPSPVTNFVESKDFLELRRRLGYPTSVALWNRIHTLHWAKWVNRSFPGVKLNESDW